MKLSTEDAQLFYDLWFPLLDHVNQNHHITGMTIKFTGEKVDPNDAGIVADFLWNRPELIDHYLKEAELSVENREIVSGWKRRIRGSFYLERHLKRGSIMISDSENQVYRVLGLFSSWEEMFSFRPLPVLIKATLLPFKGKIISDGLVIPYNVMFGGNIKSELRQCYMSAKKNGRIITSI